MEDNFYKDDFEKFLQDQVKQHRMFPSDSIWRNIHNKLHHDYKWPALTIAAVGFVAAIIAVSVYFSPGPNIFEVKNTPATILQKSNPQSTTSAILTSGYKKVSPLKRERFIISKNTSMLPGAVPDNFVNPSAHKAAPTISEIQNQGELTISAGDAAVSKEFPVVDAIDQLSSPAEQAKVALADLTRIELPDFAEDYNRKNLPGEKQIISSIKSSSKKRQTKFEYQVYITPSASYRKLQEDKSEINKQPANLGGPVAINYVSDINQVVRHKPGTGMEAGINFLYQLTDKLKIKSGFQLNARQYSIEAYSSPTEVVTIALMTAGVVDSFFAYSSYRISNGFEARQLENRYYQVSIPVGLEYEVAGNKIVRFNIAAGVQPTYMISPNAFLISSNFKNYIESPGMTRKWNVNANFETYLSIKSGTYRWQFGPQFRYQMLPSSIDEYPIKEYLIDYGIKIGVSKSIR